VPRDYKNIKQKKPAPLTQRFSGALSFLTGLSLGLFIAVIVYFHEHNASIEKNNPLLVNEPVIDDASVTDNKNEDIAQLPEPQFDFYKILPNKEVNISEWESVEEDSTSTQPIFSAWSLMARMCAIALELVLIKTRINYNKHVTDY